jgi:hypothetical protein
LQQIFTARVKLLDDFYDRFNLNQKRLNENYPNLFTDSLFKSESFEKLRRKMILSLIERIKRNPDSAVLDTFINQIVLKNFGISFYDSAWYADFNCTFSLNKEQIKISIIMQNELCCDGASKWVIRSVKSDLFNDSPYDSTKWLPSTSNDLDFIDLKYRIFTEDRKNIASYTYKEFSHNNLDVFLFLVSKGLLKFVKSNYLQYHFLQLDSWIFTLSYFDRRNVSSGWLIDNILHVNDAKKQEYMKKVLNLE